MINCQFLTTTLYLYGILLVMGLVGSARSITMPIIMRQFKLTYDEEGMFASSLTVASIISSTTSTIVLKYVSHKTEFILSWVIIAFGSFFASLIKAEVGAILGLIIISFGTGILQISTNSFSSIFFTENKGIWVNIAHGIFGVGSIFGPLIASSVSYSSCNSYRTTYLIFAISSIVITVLLYFGKFQKVEYNEVPSSPELTKQESSIPTIPVDLQPEISICECLRDKLVWLYAVILGIQVNIEIAATNWSVLYIEDVLKLSSKKEGSLFMTVYYILFTLSRLTTGGIIQKIGFINSLIITVTGSLILFTIGFILINKTGMYLLMGTGFFLSIFFPTLMCSVMEVYESQSSTPTSVIITIEGMLVGIMNYFQGLMSEKIGKAWGYRTTIPLSLLSLILLFLLKKMSNNRIEERRNLLKEEEQVNIDIEMNDFSVIDEENDVLNNNHDILANTALPKVRKEHIELVKVYSSSSSSSSSEDEGEKEETSV